MAASTSKKMRSKARWLVVSHDASLYYNCVISSHKTEAGARAELKKYGMFRHVRQETPEEVVKRLVKPELPNPCYMWFSMRSFTLLMNELRRTSVSMQHIAKWGVGATTVLYFRSGQKDEAAHVRDTIQLLHIDYEVGTNDPTTALYHGRVLAS